MCEKVGTRSFPTEVLRSKILETIWKLQQNAYVSTKKIRKNMGTYMVEVSDMTTKTTRRLAPSILRLISEKHIAGPEFGVTKGGQMGRIHIIQ